jgi:hypothetical protein
MSTPFPETACSQQDGNDLEIETIEEGGRGKTVQDRIGVLVKRPFCGRRSEER